MPEVSTIADKQKEFLKCAQDPVYFMRNYCYIQHQSKGKILFKLFPFQERTLTELEQHRFNVILKARQMGISTLVAGYALWLMLFQSDKKVLVVSLKRAVARNLVDKVKLMHELLPAWLQESTIEDNALSLSFANGSKIFAESTTGNSGRSESLSLLIIDEAAFIRDIEKLWTSAKLTLDVGKGHAVVLSTPNGIGGFYHKVWADAVNGADLVTRTPSEIWTGTGINDFHPIKLHWKLHPERGQAWRDEQTATMGEKQAAQECFDGDTRIYTIDGLKRIKDIQIGDLVLTHKGRYRKVVRLYNSVSNNIYEFTSNKNKKVSYVTGNHPFLTIDNLWMNASDIINKSTLCSFPLNDKSTSSVRYTTDVISIAKSSVEELKVYNIEVEEDHTYVTEHFVVHNCDCDFLSSGDGVIDTEIIQWYVDNTVREPILKKSIRGTKDLWIWKRPDLTETYVLCADVARGDSKEYSAFNIFTVEDVEQVAEYKGLIEPNDFGDLIASVGKYYNNAVVVVERNNYGWSTLQRLILREYKNLIYTSNDTKLIEYDKFSNSFYKNEKKLKPGLNTSGNTRPNMITKWEEYVRKRYCIIRSSRYIEELSTFIWKGGGYGRRAEHMDGYTDDLILSNCFGLWVRDTALKLHARNKVVSEKTLSAISTSKGVYSNSSIDNNPYNYKVSDKDSEDLRKWL